MIKYTSIKDLKSKDLPTDMKEFSSSRNKNQLLFFRNMKNYGEFINRYRMLKVFIGCSHTIDCLFFCDIFRELILSINNSNSHFKHLLIELFILGPFVGTMHIYGELIKSYKPEMNNKMKREQIIQRIIKKGK